jgi:hypothetical protein
MTLLYTLQITITQRLLFSVTVFISRCLVVAYNDGHSPSCGFPNCSWPQLPDSHNCNSQLTQTTTVKVKVKVTLRLTVTQAVSQSWCRAPDHLFITV